MLANQQPGLVCQVDRLYFGRGTQSGFCYWPGLCVCFQSISSHDSRICLSLGLDGPQGRHQSAHILEWLISSIADPSQSALLALSYLAISPAF